MEDGLLKQVTESFLLDAISYTEAESRMYAICERDISGDFSITQITKTNVAEVIFEEGSALWFKSKVVYATVDGDSEKEVKINTYLMVNADNVKQAYDRIETHLNSMLVPYEIPSISLSNILDVYPYSADEEKIPANLKPLSEITGED